jgi:hypothetical protein
MHYVVATRFNKETWEQNKNYREKNNIQGSIYGIPREPNEKIFNSFPFIVIEMNLNESKIMGIGLVPNKIYFDKKYNIYNDTNYNRYIFKSEYRIDRCEMLLQKESKVFLKVFEQILFKISKRYKKGIGFTQLPSWMRFTKAYDYNSVLIQMFKKKYSLNNELCNSLSQTA